MTKTKVKTKTSKKKAVNRVNFSKPVQQYYYQDTGDIRKESKDNKVIKFGITKRRSKKKSKT